jgi:hypothetical protein
MAYRTLELQIRSAQGLKYVNHIRDMRTYAVVFICDDNNNRISYEAKTEYGAGPGPDGGSNPRWNFDVMFNIDIEKAQQHGLALVVRLMSHHSLRPDTLIGEVRVPITVLLEWFGDAAEDVNKEARRNVVTAGGQEKGTLAFLYKFGRPLQHPPADPAPVNGQSRRVWKKLLRKVPSHLLDAVLILLVV